MVYSSTYNNNKLGIKKARESRAPTDTTKSTQSNRKSSKPPLKTNFEKQKSCNN